MTTRNAGLLRGDAHHQGSLFLGVNMQISSTGLIDTPDSNLYTLQIVQGATFQLVLSVSGVDLTGATADMVFATNVVTPQITPYNTILSMDTVLINGVLSEQYTVVPGNDNVTNYTSVITNVFEPTTTNGGIVISVVTPLTNQTLTVTLTSAATLTPVVLASGTYDLFVTLSNGTRLKILYGNYDYQKSLAR